MAKPKRTQFHAPPKSCVYCGKPAKRTKDHVPPRSLFMEPMPKDLITVPACEVCNGGFSVLDTAFKEWLGFALGVSDANRNRYWQEKLLPTVRNNQKRHREILEGLHLVTIAGPNQVAAVEMHALNIEADIQKQMIARLVRGLWFKEFKGILPADVPVRQMRLDNAEGMDEFLHQCKWRHLENQFSYGVGTDKEHQWTSCWFFLFHGGNFTMALTGDAANLIDDE